MLYTLSRFKVIISFVCIGCSSSVKNAKAHVELKASMLKPYGRYIMDGNGGLDLISSAVHFGFSFEGKECNIFASVPDTNGHGYVQYELDGIYQKRIRINGNSSQPFVIATANNGSHTVWIYKTTEAKTGSVVIQKITGKNVKPLEAPDAPLIDFIGNSITCGAASDTSDMPCSSGLYHDHHNSYDAYGPRVARALGTNFILTSVSGIGIYRNWNSDGPAMPEVYEKTDFGTTTQLWNFNLYNPKIVSIALGTNDMSKGDGIKKRLPFDSALFVSNYIKFVQLVKSKYPRAQIALLSSPMVNGDNRIMLQNCLAAVKENIDSIYTSGKRVATYFFNPMQAHGCGGHPSVEEQGIMANELIPFFKKLLE